MTVGRIDLTCDAVVMIDALVHQFGGIDRKVQLMTDAAHALDMIGMIVGNDQMMNRVHRQPEVPEILLQSTYADTSVDHQTVVFCI